MGEPVSRLPIRAGRKVLAVDGTEVDDVWFQIAFFFKRRAG